MKLLLLAGFLTGSVSAQTIPPYVLSSPMLPLLVQMPQNGWLQVNANFFSDVWTPPDLEPLFGSGPGLPSHIIQPWSGFAWDSNRGDLILYGGGHANYSGNDIYRWHSSTLLWERASLPSEIRYDPVAGYQAIDGVDAAPSAAHTYQNNMFFPIVDRFLTWGGAAYDNGGPYLAVSTTNPTQTRYVGPYLFDPNRANGNRVGGTTGSQVTRVAPHPEIIGGRMWENRDIYLYLAGQTLPVGHVSGCAAYATELGHDVAYVASTSGGSTNLDLYRYQLTDLSSPALDQISKVGVFWVGTSGDTTCGFDPVRKLFVRTGNNAAPFTFWDLTKPGLGNLDQRVAIESTIASLQSWLTQQNLNIQNCALVFDPVRSTYPLWCGAATIWELHEPPSANTASGWSVTQNSAPQTAAPPGDTTTTGVLGKWRYAPNYDVFVGLNDIVDGNIWIYKPAGWVQPNPPGNALPTVTITSPSNGLSIAPATPLSPTALASDSDGTIAKVKFYVNGTMVGQATSSPYSVGLTPMFVGSYTVVAVAIDNVGGMTASAPVDFTVSAPLATATLQRGLNGYAGVTDTYLDAFNRTTAWGGSSLLYLDSANYTPLLRFEIFQSEGGPVVNGSVIQSATLALYKQYYDDTLSLNALLKPWVEGQATWTISQSAAPWSVGGAAGAGFDYIAAPDSLVAGSFNPGWVAFDVTSRVQQWSNGAMNYGWRLAQPSGSHLMQFNSSEYASNPTLRPTLAIVYALDSSATVTLASSANPALTGTSVTFTATAATAAGNVPAGKVVFSADGGTIAGCPVVAMPAGAATSKRATCRTSALSVGVHSIVASYYKDAVNSASTSVTLSQVVNSERASTTTLASSANPSLVGARVTFTATVSGTAPTGSVGFTSDGAAISGCGAVALLSGGARNAPSAICSTDALTQGTHSIVATYSGNASSLGSASLGFSQVVEAPTKALASYSRITEIEAWGK